MVKYQKKRPKKKNYLQETMILLEKGLGKPKLSKSIRILREEMEKAYNLEPKS